VIDSSSDIEPEVPKLSNYRIVRIDRKNFNHGRTRQLGVDALEGSDIIVFMTQDALLAGIDAIGNIVLAFDNPRVSAAYGRQLPHKGATKIEAHARLYNYPDMSYVRSIDDAQYYGIKAAFISNSFSAYRRSDLIKVGGFPSNVILGEDTYVAAKMLLSGMNIAYCANAIVYHSHDYTLKEEFSRYFDIGVFHSREGWVVAKLGGVSGEGLKFVLSEFKYLTFRNPLLVTSSIIRNYLKYIGYKLGMHHNFLPLWLVRFFSMHKNYWN